MNISNISNQLYTTAPDKTGRLPKEMAVYSLLDELSIPYERVAENCFLPSDDSWQKKV